jgi:hypothetical protein
VIGSLEQCTAFVCFFEKPKMENNMKMRFLNAFAFGAAFVAVAVLGSTGIAAAGSKPHTMPAEATRALSAYEIRVVTMPTDGKNLVVQVVNKSNGQAVENAHVSMRHWVPGHAKLTPGPQQAMIPLQADGHGGYICTREHIGHGERVEVRAHVPGDFEGTWATLTIDN